MAALNTSAMNDSVAVIADDICKKKLHVDNVAAFLIPSSCLHTA